MPSPSWLHPTNKLSTLLILNSSSCAALIVEDEGQCISHHGFSMIHLQLLEHIHHVCERRHASWDDLKQASWRARRSHQSQHEEMYVGKSRKGASIMDSWTTIAGSSDEHRLSRQKAKTERMTKAETLPSAMTQSLTNRNVYIENKTNFATTTTRTLWFWIATSRRYCSKVFLKIVTFLLSIHTKNCVTSHLSWFRTLASYSSFLLLFVWWRVFFPSFSNSFIFNPSSMHRYQHLNLSMLVWFLLYVVVKSNYHSMMLLMMIHRDDDDGSLSLLQEEVSATIGVPFWNSSSSWCCCWYFPSKLLDHFVAYNYLFCCPFVPLPYYFHHQRRNPLTIQTRQIYCHRRHDHHKLEIWYYQFDHHHDLVAIFAIVSFRLPS